LYQTEQMEPRQGGGTQEQGKLPAVTERKSESRKAGSELGKLKRIRLAKSYHFVYRNQRK